MRDLVTIENEWLFFWYQNLIADLKQLNFEGIVKTKHAIGKRIIEDELKFEKPKYGEKTIKNLAKDLETDYQDLYRCIQFVKKYPEYSVIDRKLSWRNITRNLLPEKSSIHFSSESSEWTTPKLIINKTLELFKEIDLDPCSNPDFPNIPANNHFQKKEDGLSKDWYGKIYMNPPYGNIIKKWIEKVCIEYEKNNIKEAIILVPSRTDTNWFRCIKNYPRCFIWGRLKFGDNDNSAPFPSMVVYLGRNCNEFIKIFSDIGDIYKLVK